MGCSYVEGLVILYSKFDKGLDMILVAKIRSVRLIMSSSPYMYLFRILHYSVICWVIGIELLLCFCCVLSRTVECYFVNGVKQNAKICAIGEQNVIN